MRELSTLRKAANMVTDVGLVPSGISCFLLKLFFPTQCASVLSIYFILFFTYSLHLVLV